MDVSAIIDKIDSPLKLAAFVVFILTALLYALVELRSGEDDPPGTVQVINSGQNSVVVGINEGTINNGINAE